MTVIINVQTNNCFKCSILFFFSYSLHILTSDAKMYKHKNKQSSLDLQMEQTGQTELYIPGMHFKQ